MADVIQSVAKLRFAEWVYGTPESPRIAVVVADLGDGRFKLYADKDRDRGVDERDVLNGQYELCSVDVMAQQITDNIVHEYPRTVLFPTAYKLENNKLCVVKLSKNGVIFCSFPYIFKNSAL